MDQTLEIMVKAAACKYIQAKVQQEQGAGLRLTIKKTGCSGFSYAPSIVTEALPDDVVIKIEEGLVLFIDPKWLSVFHHLIIDYVEDDKSGLKQKRLTFTNPNEGERCGCGESFYLGD
ncbi:MAG: iron-sulfur cluster assembly accessory protein [Gammaproteobacteria bacterium]|nr:iron-sulfur cluster assembly accessory protein [Gammaproteobacteria bacterium]